MVHNDPPGRRGTRTARLPGCTRMSELLSTEVGTLPELLRLRARELGDTRFVRDARQEWSYAEFVHRASQMAAGLRELVVRRGDVVGVILPNSPHYLEVWW